MKPSIVLILAIAAAASRQAEAGPPIIENTSLVRVRADNRFGITDDVTRTPTLPMSVTDSITDDEVGTAATATDSATYTFTLNGTTATFNIEIQQSFSVGARGNVA